MKSSWDEAWELPEFRTWFSEQEKTANYFVAFVSLKNDQQALRAFKLNLASAWLAGRSSLIENAPQVYGYYTPFGDSWQSKPTATSDTRARLVCIEDKVGPED